MSLELGQYVTVDVSPLKSRGGILTSISLTSGKGMVDFGEGFELSYDLDLIKPGAPQPTEPTGGTKYDQDKPHIALIPHEALFEIGSAMTYGAKKYAAHNWRGGFQWLRLVSALNRHMWAWVGGEDNDPESGLSHLAHAGACICILIGMVKSNLGEDDRWKQ